MLSIFLGFHLLFSNRASHLVAPSLACIPFVLKVLKDGQRERRKEGGKEKKEGGEEDEGSNNQGDKDQGDIDGSSGG